MTMTTLSSTAPCRTRKGKFTSSDNKSQTFVKYAILKLETLVVVARLCIELSSMSDTISTTLIFVCHKHCAPAELMY